MKKLESVNADSSKFDQQIGELETTLRDHVADEESDQFSQLRATMHAATTDALRDRPSTSVRRHVLNPDRSA